MENYIKFLRAIKSLKSDALSTTSGSGVITVRHKNHGMHGSSDAIVTTTNPHSELTWTKVNNAMTALQTAYDGVGVVQRKRATEYASLKEQLDLLYKDMAADKGDKDWRMV